MASQVELRKLIEQIKKREGTDTSCAIRDLITDLMHVCRESNIDFQDRVDAALAVFHEETLDQEATE